MRILAQHNVDGMVRCLDASEIPPLAVMDVVEGPDLRRAVQAGLIKSWACRLRVMSELAQIVQRAHALPERVLHRDIRPTNIMFTTWSPDDWAVRLLDFDLSWHKGAIEKSILAATSVHGYLAPEQLTVRKGVSSRHASVDSFGFGMTMYYLCASAIRHPEFTCWRVGRTPCGPQPVVRLVSGSHFLLASRAWRPSARWTVRASVGTWGKSCESWPDSLQHRSTRTLCVPLTSLRPKSRRTVLSVGLGSGRSRRWRVWPNL
jgi:serine/threonine protein kinase